jgi:hypothetical protein
MWRGIDLVALDEKARANPSASVPRVKQAWRSYQERNFREQAAFEKEFAALQKRDPQKALKLVTDHATAVTTEICTKAGELMKSLEWNNPRLHDRCCLHGRVR